MILETIIFILSILSIGIFVMLLNIRNNIDHSHSRFHLSESYRNDISFLDNLISANVVVMLLLIVANIFIFLFINI